LKLVDADMILADGNVGIKPFDINFQELPADANNAFQCLLMVS
jgi:hypothetical protein